MNFQSGKRLFLFFTFWIFLASFFLKASAAELSDFSRLELAKNRVLAYQYQAGSNKNLPTLVFMPGIRRSMTLDAPALQDLLQAGFGVATFNFSTHALSGALLDKSIQPFYLNHSISLEDLRDEAQLFFRFVESFKAPESPLIPVSLSFSGAVSPFIKGYPFLIDTAPLTSSRAANEQADNFRRNLIAAQIFNPIFGPALTRSTLDQSYRKNWESTVKDLSQQFRFSPRASLVEGYVAMSRALEGFSWLELQDEIQGQRLFVIGELEDSKLKADQVKTFQKLKGSILFREVKKAGHNVPADNPTGFSKLLQESVFQLLETDRVDIGSPLHSKDCKSIF